MFEKTSEQLFEQNPSLAPTAEGNEHVWQPKQKQMKKKCHMSLFFLQQKIGNRRGIGADQRTGLIAIRHVGGVSKVNNVFHWQQAGNSIGDREAANTTVKNSYRKICVQCVFLFASGRFGLGWSR